VGLEAGGEAKTTDTTTKGMTTTAAAGVLDGPTSFEPTSAFAAYAVREAAEARQLYIKNDELQDPHAGAQGGNGSATKHSKSTCSSS
jgi:hypothetical protein